MFRCWWLCCCLVRVLGGSWVVLCWMVGLLLCGVMRKGVFGLLCYLVCISLCWLLMWVLLVVWIFCCCCCCVCCRLSLKVGCWWVWICVVRVLVLFC